MVRVISNEVESRFGIKFGFVSVSVIIKLCIILNGKIQVRTSVCDRYAKRQLSEHADLQRNMKHVKSCSIS